MPEGFIQRHFANLRHIRDIFRIDPRAERGTGQIAPWLSGVVQLVHPAIPGSFQFANLQVRSRTNPAVATDFELSVQPNEAWGLRGLRFQLVTDANVANREVNVVLDDGTNNFMLIPPAVVQAASTTQRYAYGRAVGYTHQIGSNQLMSFPDLVMDTDWRIRSNVVNMQAGDQISSIFFLLEVFTR